MTQTAKTWTAVSAAAVAIGLAPAAATEAAVDARATIVAAIGDQDGPAEIEPLTARADLYLDLTRTLPNGADIGVSLALGAESDHPWRDPRGGFMPGAPAGVRGPLSGFTGAGPADEDVRGAVEAAFVSVRGGWGEAAIGRDQGAAARFSLTPPEALRSVGAFERSLDPTGLGAPVLRNDLTGVGAKITLETPRLLGLKAAASYTPEADAEGLDQGFPALALTDALEAGLSFTRTFRTGAQTAAALTFASADGRFGRVESWGGGGQLAAGGWTFGAAALAAGGGPPGGDYRAFGFGLTRALGDWTIGLAGGRSADDLTQADIDTASVSAQRRIGERLAIGGAWRVTERRTAGGRAESEVLLLELTWVVL